MTAAIKSNFAWRAAAVVGLVVLALFVARVALAGVEIAIMLAVILVVGVGVYILRDWNLLLYAMVLSVFVEGVGIGPARVGRILSVVALLAIGARMVLGGWRPGPQRVWSWTPLVLLVTWAWASGFWADDSSAWATGVGRLALAGAYFATFALLITRHEQVRPMIIAYLIGALVVAPIALLEYFSGARAVGLQGDPNQFAMYQAAAIPIVVHLARRGTNPLRHLWLLSFIPLMLSILVSGSRGGLLTAALLLVLLYIPWRLFRASRGERSLMPFAVLGLVLLGLGTAYLIGVEVDERLDLGTIVDDHGSSRLELWYVGWNVYVEHPWHGIGLSNYEAQSADLLATTPGVERNVDRLIELGDVAAHNTYLEFLVNLGVIGLALFLWLLAATGINLLGARRRWRGAGLEALPAMLLTVCIGAAVMSIINNKLLFILAGIGAALAAIERTPSPSPSPTATPVSITSP